MPFARCSLTNCTAPCTCAGVQVYRVYRFTGSPTRMNTMIRRVPRGSVNTKPSLPLPAHGQYRRGRKGEEREGRRQTEADGSRQTTQDADDKQKVSSRLVPGQSSRLHDSLTGRTRLSLTAAAAPRLPMTRLHGFNGAGARSTGGSALEKKRSTKPRQALLASEKTCSSPSSSPGPYTTTAAPTPPARSALKML
jgi:hypothetical protein